MRRQRVATAAAAAALLFLGNVLEPEAAEEHVYHVDAGLVARRNHVAVRHDGMLLPVHTFRGLGKQRAAPSASACHRGAAAAATHATASAASAGGAARGARTRVASGAECPQQRLGLGHAHHGPLWAQPWRGCRRRRGRGRGGGGGGPPLAISAAVETAARSRLHGVRCRWGCAVGQGAPLVADLVEADLEERVEDGLGEFLWGRKMKGHEDKMSSG